MARLYEFQAKEILAKEGVPVPGGKVVGTAAQARSVTAEMAKPVAIKAQVLATGRFKAGGIRFSDGPEQAEEASQSLLDNRIKGLPVECLLIEPKLDIDREFYVGIAVSDSVLVKGPVMVFCIEGGVDIEEVAARNPERIARLPINYLRGIETSEVEQLLSKVAVDGGLPPEVRAELGQLIGRLYDTFKKYDARVLEVNPLVLTKDKHLVAADCHFIIDDNSVFRHPELGIKVPRDMGRSPTELEEIGWSVEEGDYRGTGYFAQMVPKLDGNGWIGFHGIGGGGTMLAASAFIRRGFKLANYADTSGDPTASKVYRVIKLIMSQPIDGYVLMGSCLANQEQWHHAHAIVKAFREEAKGRPGFPVVLLIAGNKEKEAHEIIRTGLKGVPLRLELYGRDHIYDTDFIADRMVQLLHEYSDDRKLHGEN